jgi:hypothetical protein
MLQAAGQWIVATPRLDSLADGNDTTLCWVATTCCVAMLSVDGVMLGVSGGLPDPAFSELELLDESPQELATVGRVDNAYSASGP